MLVVYNSLVYQWASNKPKSSTGDFLLFYTAIAE